MKKVLTIVLVFAVILAVLLGADALWKRFAPEPEPVEETEREMVVTNTMDPENATVIRLADGATTTLGVGAVVQADGASVTIVYPGTYRVEGTLTDGQIVVDLGDFNGTVYLILNGASVTSSSGPALYVAESGLTVLYLVDDTDNFLQDGQDYLVQEQQEKKTGAGIYSADDLVIAGGGALTVYGRSSDGIRTKDAMAVMGGALTVYSQDDGLQASDYLKISGGDITVGAYGDGVSTTDGFVATVVSTVAAAADVILGALSAAPALQPSRVSINRSMRVMEIRRVMAITPIHKVFYNYSIITERVQAVRWKQMLTGYVARVNIACPYCMIK
jgi:hypothetical protein